ncbi:bifunctional N-acetylglucosamine-1-phosphate uridyltransferase/glucosamine-1-phosphate acetyltransferase [Anaerosporomusa subterranea]|uniref:Bifunctional protein GlmU n=1 Tax=Anaerosporomusa subterranea TaxID=1794912 RepID=A0A154BQW1_ANASB|nr:bifunctional UDP-N-acetylglucosamine diphosphorylase/glucosamine-1-phosphate N-acetyltransferase GlmU [Anaerosporomusa subterranea]KYZ76311.1 bifunctional N-acetylglucosamine-1-phosphate uridyltransferase/glucosamine-1-phosphate acetyltransferase [Anaerosporomusa subterranea]
MSGFTALILAAGKGTRMKSELPKVLHKVSSKPMLLRVLDAAEQAGATASVAVVGFGADQVQKTLGARAQTAIQAEQLGTGHAVMQAESLLQGCTGTIMVLCGDTPLLRAATLQKLLQTHRQAQAQATVLTAIMPNPAGYGRVIRDRSGKVVKIVEQKDASVEEAAVNEINTGIYCFEKSSLFATLALITADNAQGEYYLTDVIGILTAQNQAVAAVAADEHQETMGINSRAQLAQAEAIVRNRKLTELMDAGVTIMDPNSVFVDDSVSVGSDTILYPFTWLEGATTIGSCCEIGPNTRLQNTVVGDNTVIHFSYTHECEIGCGVTVGPYVHIRPDSILADGVKVGNFVEVKNSQVGPGTKLPHLSYIGDADLGAGINIGCGTITVNYDGKKKHRTVIEDNAFIGCNSNLVAPVKVGSGAYVAAGSTVTKNVPPDALGVARARQTNIENWVKRQR